MIGWRGIPLIGLVLAAWPAAGQDLQAMKQFGTSGTDRAFGVAVDATGAYVAGTTTGSFPGFSNQGSTDAFIRKLDKNGIEIWTRQMGTSSREEVWAVAVDATGVYVAGATSGSMSGNTSQGAQDAFITKFDLNGLELWTRQFGSFGNDKVLGMAAADGALYVCGSASDALPSQSAFGQSDAFLRKYTTGGAELWTRQLGTSATDEAWASRRTAPVSSSPGTPTEHCQGSRLPEWPTASYFVSTKTDWSSGGASSALQPTIWLWTSHWAMRFTCWG